MEGREDIALYDPLGRRLVYSKPSPTVGVKFLKTLQLVNPRLVKITLYRESRVKGILTKPI